jgi:hypothetical protein
MATTTIPPLPTPETAEGLLQLQIGLGEHAASRLGAAAGHLGARIYILTGDDPPPDNLAMAILQDAAVLRDRFEEMQHTYGCLAAELDRHGLWEVRLPDQPPVEPPSPLLRGL